MDSPTYTYVQKNNNFLNWEVDLWFYFCDWNKRVRLTFLESSILISCTSSITMSWKPWDFFPLTKLRISWCKKLRWCSQTSPSVVLTPKNTSKNKLNKKYSVSNSSESETALFPARNGQNPPPFFSSQNMTPYAIFIAFLCDNFSHTNSKLQKNFEF